MGIGKQDFHHFSLPISYFPFVFYFLFPVPHLLLWRLPVLGQYLLNLVGIVLNQLCPAHPCC